MKLPRPLVASSLLALLLAGPLSAQSVARPEPLARIVAAAEESDQVSDHLKTLVTVFGPRLTSSTNLERANEWARAKFESFGLEATIEEWGTFPVGFDRGPWSGRMLAPEESALDFGTNSWTPGTRGAAAGPAVAWPPSADAVRADAGRYRGAWIVAPPAQAGRAPGGAGAQGGAGAAAERQAIEGALEEAGALGVVRPTRNHLIVTSGSYRIDGAKLPKLVRVSLRVDQHKGLHEKIEAGEEVRLEFDVQNRFLPGPVPVSNVIARLQGTEWPDEYVVVGGHIDSWDGAVGTTDNGTGVSTTLEAARLLTAAGLKPKRTILFMLWSGEEQGLLGSRGWIAKHKDMLPKISAVLVHDGGTAYVSGILATPAMKPLFDEVLGPLAALDPTKPFEIREVPGLPAGIGSDHDAFLREGVPGFFWSQSRDVDYNRTHHTQFDTLDAARPDYQRHSARVIAYGAYALAGLPALLPRENLVAPRGTGGGRGAGARRLLGVSLGGDGLEIESVSEDSVAAKAGLQPGDTILQIGETKLASAEDLRTALRSAGAKATVVVRRDGATKTVEVEWPAAERPGADR